MRLILQVEAITMALAFLVGCGKQMSVNVFDLNGVTYRLKPLREAVPVDLSQAEFVEGCSWEVRERIALCLGQIDIPKLNVKRVWVSWSEKPLAAKVQLDGRNYIYLSYHDENWHLEGGVLAIR